MPVLCLICVFCGLIQTSITEAAEQEKPAPAPAQTIARPLRVFLECTETFCDMDYQRTETTYVDWVRDRRDADVHVIATSLNTATGGREYTLRFIGLQSFAGLDDVLTFIVRQNAPDDETRQKVAQYLRLGLARYLARTESGGELQLSKRAAPKDKAAAKPGVVHDPWNLWVLRARFSGSGEGEESSSETQYEAGLTANRTTEAWKFDVGGEVSYSEDKFVLDEEDESDIFVAVSRNSWLRGQVVKSLTTHWSAAATSEISTSTFENRDFSTTAGVGVEYDIFPYAEFTKRRWTFQYVVGFGHHRYDELTVYEKTSQTLMAHSLDMNINATQPWGQVGASFSFDQYLSDLSKYRLEADGEVELRLFRGFSLNVSGEVSRIRDQIFLRAGRATPEEILVRQRELATGYSYDYSIGITYTFGSIYNNVVNPRFR